MLSKQENELLTRVGPGTPCGELVRRYWQPVCFAAELTAARPTKRVKVLHEELVVYRDQPGTYGCLAEHCAHRGASLAYGFVEEGGLRCAYHGWQYDACGRCLEQPFEPKGSTYRERVRQQAYSAQTLAGLVFIYMGPQPAPLLPRWDVLVREDGQRILEQHPVLQCNWLQAMENSADVTHTYFLHGHTLYQQGVRGRQVDYYYRPFEQYGFQPFEWGLLKSWRYGSGGSALGEERGGGNPLIFPNILRVVQHPGQVMHWRVPIDDTHTNIFLVWFFPNKTGTPEKQPEHPPIREVARQKTPDGEYPMDNFPSQDKMAWETQGPLFDRSAEHLGASDRGIVLYRQMLREQIAVVQRGGEPLGTIRDPAKNQLIELPTWIAEVDLEKFAGPDRAVPTRNTMDEFFDERHEVFEVPFGAARPLGG